MRRPKRQRICRNLDSPKCRILPVLVQRFLGRSSTLETMITRLEELNKQLVPHVGEQQQDMRKISDQISNPITGTIEPKPQRGNATGLWEKIYTGASCTVISIDYYDILSKAQPAQCMNKYHTKLMSYGGHNFSVKCKVTINS